VAHGEGMTLPEVLRHCADLAEQIEGGQLPYEQERSRLSYLLLTLSEARAYVETMWRGARGG
jgi:hypothetical protein